MCVIDISIVTQWVSTWNICGIGVLRVSTRNIYGIGVLSWSWLLTPVRYLLFALLRSWWIPDIWVFLVFVGVLVLLWTTDKDLMIDGGWLIVWLIVRLSKLVIIIVILLILFRFGLLWSWIMMVLERHPLEMVNHPIVSLLLFVLLRLWFQIKILQLVRWLVDHIVFHWY
jgi:hypothetical protein